jgi:hypothetical protein
MVLQTNPPYQEANDMLTPKLRTTMIALVATVGVTAASVIPAVSQASKNTGAYSKSAEAQKKKQEHCLASQQAWLDAVEGYNAAEVGSQRATELADVADSMRAFGKAEGCAWAGRVQPLQSPRTGVLAPVGPIQAAPETVTPVRTVTATPSPLPAK